MVNVCLQAARVHLKAPGFPMFFSFSTTSGHILSLQQTSKDSDVRIPSRIGCRHNYKFDRHTISLHHKTGFRNNVSYWFINQISSTRVKFVTLTQTALENRNDTVNVYSRRLQKQSLQCVTPLEHFTSRLWSDRTHCVIINEDVCISNWRTASTWYAQTNAPNPAEYNGCHGDSSGSNI